MTVKIDVLALAREAGFEVYCDKNQNRHAWVEGVRCTHDLVQFAALVLERAAGEVEKTKIAFDGKNLQTGFVLQQAEFAIRALKPAQGNDKT